MNARRLLTLLLCALSLAASMPSQAQRPDNPVPGEVILQIEEGQSAADVAATHALTLVSQFGNRPIWRARVAPGNKVGAVLRALQADSRVRYAEAHIEHQTPEGRHNVVWAIGGSQTEWAQQWAPQSLRLPLAHQHATGQGVVVAILDTGVELTHPIVAPRLRRTAEGQLVGRDFVDGDADPSEQGSPADPGFGHGTHVAGLIALSAPDAALMPARVLTPAGQGNLWVLAEALLWAVDPDGDPATADGAQVINLSLGTTRRTHFLDQVIGLVTCHDDDDDDGQTGSGWGDPGFEDDKRRCERQGGSVVVAAAGNDGGTTPCILRPSAPRGRSRWQPPPAATAWLTSRTGAAGSRLARRGSRSSAASRAINGASGAAHRCPLRWSAAWPHCCANGSRTGRRWTSPSASPTAAPGCARASCGGSTPLPRYWTRRLRAPAADQCSVHEEGPAWPALVCAHRPAGR
jgi:Subtilase family